MVVLKSLLALGGTKWPLDDIARHFLNYYLENRERLADWDELARYEDPARFPLTGVVAHLMRMPLDKMASSGADFFELDKKRKIFRVHQELNTFWVNTEFQQLIADRADFALARYFYRKEKTTVLADTMRGFAVEVPYTTRSDSGFSKTIRKVIADAPSSNNWEFEFDKSGYSGRMDLEIQNEHSFVAWTSVRYDDISRFPARIKAAATALFNEGQRGEFNITAAGTRLVIARK